MPISSRRVHGPPGLGVERRHVAVRRSRALPLKTRLAARGRRRDRTSPRGGFGAGIGELVVVQRGQLRRDEVAARSARRRSPRARRPGTWPCRSAAGSKNVPWPCICEVRRRRRSSTVPSPSRCRCAGSTPASPNAGGISVAAVLPSGRNALPSRIELGVELARAPARAAPCAPSPRRRRSRSGERLQVGRASPRSRRR